MILDNAVYGHYDGNIVQYNLEITSMNKKTILYRT